MRKDLIAVGIAIPVVAVIVLSLNKGKAVSVAPAATKQASAQDLKAMDSVCKNMIGLDKSKVTAKIGKPYNTTAGVSYYLAASAGFKPPYALAITFNKKKKVQTAKAVPY
jgi:hypothetical protein